MEKNREIEMKVIELLEKLATSTIDKKLEKMEDSEAKELIMQAKNMKTQVETLANKLEDEDLKIDALSSIGLLVDSTNRFIFETLNKLRIGEKENDN